jgi:hypothetical protein
LAFNCDGSRLATGSQDQTIRIWKAEDIASVSIGHSPSFLVTLCSASVLVLAFSLRHPRGWRRCVQTRQEVELRGTHRRRHVHAVAHCNWFAFEPAASDGLGSTFGRLPNSQHCTRLVHAMSHGLRSMLVDFYLDTAVLYHALRVAQSAMQAVLTCRALHKNDECCDSLRPEMYHGVTGLDRRLLFIPKQYRRWAPLRTTFPGGR